MGKAQKFKQERKEERIKTMEKKEKRKKALKKSTAFFIILAVLVTGGILGYKKYGEQYLKPEVDKIAGVFSKKNNGDSEKKEPKKDPSTPEATKDKKGEDKVDGKSYKTGDKKYSQAPDMQIDTAKKYIANFETNKGNFKIELLADKAPKTVNNFVVLAKDGFYDDLIFHRIIKDFMIQGGDPLGTGTGDPGYKFEDEQNDVKLVRGTLAMANSGPNTNGSQFFVITKDNTDWLQGKHTAFGKVIEGLEKVMEMEKVEVGENDKPKEEVKIIKLTIEEK